LEFLSFLLTKLKEKQLEKLSIMRRPGENSGSRGEKDEKIPYDLMFESIRSLGPPLRGTLLKLQEVFSRELSPTY